MKIHGNIDRAAYHGGTLTGVQNELIMNEFKQACMRYFSLPQQQNTSTASQLAQKFKIHQEIFLALDTVFSILRKLSPTHEEILNFSMVTKRLEKLRIQGKISLQLVKLYVLLVHTST